MRCYTLADNAIRFNIANSLVFVITVLLANFRVIDVFSSDWMHDGFCIVNKGTPWQSHALCFYSDTFFAIILICVASGDPLMKPVVNAIPGIFAHGAGHLLLFATDIPTDPRIHDNSVLALTGGVCAASLFYYLLLRPFNVRGIHSIIHGFITWALLPARFGFTYVQTVLTLLSQVAELKRPPYEKDVYYTAWVLIVSVPVVFVGWFEAMFCEAFMYLGGHVVYDTMISLCTCVYVCVIRSGCLNRIKESM